MSVSSSHFDGMKFLSQTSIQYRTREVAAALDRWEDKSGDWRVVDVEHRNRRLYDVYHLLKGDWKIDPDIKFYEAIQPHFLGEPEFPPEVPASLKERLELQIRKARKATASSFEEFLIAAPVKFDDPVEFERWYLESLPYVALGLTQRDHGAARERLKKMLQKYFRDDEDAHWESLFMEGLRHFHESAAQRDGVVTGSDRIERTSASLMS